MKNKQLLKIFLTVIHAVIIGLCIYEYIYYPPVELFYKVFLALYAILGILTIIALWFRHAEMKPGMSDVIYFLIVFEMLYSNKSSVEYYKTLNNIHSREVTEEMVNTIFEQGDHSGEEVVYSETGIDYGYMITLKENTLTTYQLDQEKITQEKHYTFDEPIEIIENTVSAYGMDYVSFYYTIDDQVYGFDEEIDPETNEKILKNQYLGTVGQEDSEEYAKNLFEFGKYYDDEQLVATYFIEGEDQCKGIIVSTYTYENDEYPSMKFIFYNETGVTYSESCTYEFPDSDFTIEYQDHIVQMGPISNGEYDVIAKYEITEDSIIWRGNTRIED